MNADSSNPVGRSAEVTGLLREVAAGEALAVDRLLPVVYDELRSLAGKYLARERPDHTMQATALVHEAYLKLVNQSDASWKDRAHFFAIAARAIRQILVDHARGHRRQKRSGGRDRIPLEAAEASMGDGPVDLLQLEDALTRLDELQARKARVVELRFFGGLSIEETAEVLAISHATVERDWNFARAWLFRELSEAEDEAPSEEGA